MVAGGGDELLANPGDLLVPGDGPPFGSYPLTAIGGDGAVIPVVTTNGNYKYVGRLVVGFDQQGRVTTWDLDNSGPVRVSGVAPDAVPPDPDVEAQVVAPVADFVAALAANIIGLSEVDLDGRRSPGVRTMETNEGNLIADSLRWQAEQLAASFGVPTPDVALQNGGGIRNDSIIPAGDISELDTFDMVPFSNFVTVLPDIPREQFKEILENAVSRTQPGDIPGGTGRFAQISGFTYEWSASGTAQELDADADVIVPGTRVETVILDDGTEIVTGGAVVLGTGSHHRHHRFSRAWRRPVSLSWCFVHDAGSHLPAGGGQLHHRRPGRPDFCCTVSGRRRGKDHRTAVGHGSNRRATVTAALGT